MSSPLLTLSYTLPPMAWIVLSAVLFTGGDVLFRFYFEYKLAYGFIGAFLIATVGLFCLVMSFPHQNIAVATVICILLNITAYMIAAYFFFGDVPSVRESLGLMMGFGAIVVLEGFK